MSNWDFSPVNVYFPIWITTLCRVLSRVWFDLSPVKFALVRTTLSVPHPMSFLGAKFFGSSMSFTFSTHQIAVLLHNLWKYFKKRVKSRLGQCHISTLSSSAHFNLPLSIDWGIPTLIFRGSFSYESKLGHLCRISFMCHHFHKIHHTLIHSYISHIHTYIYTNIHTFAYSYTHTYMHTQRVHNIIVTCLDTQIRSSTVSSQSSPHSTLH